MRKQMVVQPTHALVLNITKWCPYLLHGKKTGWVEPMFVEPLCRYSKKQLRHPPLGSSPVSIQICTIFESSHMNYKRPMRYFSCLGCYQTYTIF